MILRRIRGILAAGANDLVDRLEDPDALLRQAIRDMETSLDEATGAAAKAIASETMLLKQLAEHEQQAARWQARARAAVAEGDDDLARRALARKLDHERLAEALRAQAAPARDASRSLRRQVEAMRLELAETRRRLATLVARQKAAEARKALRVEVPVASRLGHFACVKERIERAEAEADALEGLVEGRPALDEAEFAAREERRRIEEELAALKG